MAANLEFNSQKNTYSFYSLKEVAWHGLGQIVAEAKTPEEVIRLANLDYEVALAPMYANFIPKGTDYVITTDNGFICQKIDPFTKHVTEEITIPKKGVKVPDIFATYRTDNWEVLGTVGSRYEPVQNTEAIDFIYNVCKNSQVVKPEDVIIETAGVLGKGERIFVTAKLPDYKMCDDDMEKYILFTTSHDGSGSIQACFTDVRVVCNNTLNAALQNCSNMQRFKHTKNVQNAMERGAALMMQALHYSTEAQAIFTEADKKIVNDTMILDYLTDLMCTPKEKEDVMKNSMGTMIRGTEEITSTRKLNKITEMRNFIENGVGQDSHRGTLLWVYNGITSYLNNGVKYKDKLDKFDSITQGNSYKVGQNAMNILQKRIAA